MSRPHKSPRFRRSCLAIAVFGTGLLAAGCDTGANERGTVNYTLAAVDGGSCSIFDAATGKTRLAGPVKTVGGNATFLDTPTLGFAMVRCEGGTYTDEASGKTLAAPALRSFVTIAEDKFKVSVSPLTELAILVNEVGGFNITDFDFVLANVATSFGLKGVDVATVRPYDLSKTPADKTDAGRYGLALAAFSQVQQDTGAPDAVATINQFLDGFEENGFFKDDDAQELYFDALDDLFGNPILAGKLGSVDVVESLFSDAAQSAVAATVNEIYADFTDSDDEDVDAGIEAGVPTTFGLVGENLYLGIKVKLGDLNCRVRDFGPAEFAEGEYNPQIVYADCPAADEGIAELASFDQGRKISFITVAIGAANEKAAAAKNAAAKASGDPKAMTLTYRRKGERAPQFAASAGTGPVEITGKVTGEEPTITPPDAAHNYAAITRFDVAGVTVKLLNASSAVLATTSTDATGNYRFTGVASGIAVRIVVRAQVAKSRNGGSTGPEYDFTVRDNTSTTTPKKAYELTSSAVTTNAASSPQRIDVNATIGFTAAGAEISSAARQSGPFSITRAVKSAVDNLEQTDANITMPTLDIFWSTKNIAVDGNRDLGQISTSLYAGNGSQPGVYILGKADSDTDEFDLGVLGHEFGHYLQKQLSFSDSPGGSHSSSTDFKDPSLAYGEGYGTAVGGLLSSKATANFYCDVSGSAQSGGSCDDISADPSPSTLRGFYGESSIFRLMYAIGKIPGKGFVPFWNAVTMIKAQGNSATIFAFLNNYRTANPDVDSQVLALMAKYNIKTSDPLGTLPAGSVSDSQINAAASKGIATQGADDLERIYITLPLKPATAAPPSDLQAVAITENETKFCLNSNLFGANSGNGLGMSRRFTFVSNFDGYVGVKALDDKNVLLNPQSASIAVRDDAGQTPSAFDFVNGTGVFQVANGRRYAILLNVYEPSSVFRGSRCGNKVALFHTAD